MDERAFDFLNKFLVDVTSTCMIFAAIVENEKLVSGSHVSKFLFFSLLIFLIGWIAGIFIASAVRGPQAEIAGLISFQNCGYLPLNIALFLLPPVLCREFQVYVFLYLLGFNILIWSVGSYFMFKRHQEKFDLKSFLLPPVSGTIAALLVVYLGLSRFIPEVILSPVKMVGDLTFVISAIVLGGWLAKVDLKGTYTRVVALTLASCLRLVAVPAIFFLLVVYLKLFSLVGLFVVLIAAMPSAVTLPVIVNIKGGDTAFASQGVFITHVAAVVTIPFWLGLFLRVSHFTF